MCCLPAADTESLAYAWMALPHARPAMMESLTLGPADYRTAPIKILRWNWNECSFPTPTAPG